MKKENPIPSLALRACGGVLLALALPAVAAPSTGTITARVERAGQLTRVTAIDRKTDKQYAGTIDRATGKITISGLPLGAAYDCILEAGAAKREGVNLRVPASDYEEEQPLTKEDIETIKKTARSLNQFENEVEVLAVSGNIQHAAVVLNKKRTTDFINSQPGEMIWRLELWHFEKPDETWIKVQDELAVVLYRQRLQKADFARKALTLDPALGGIELTAKKPRVDLGKIAIPPREPGIRLEASQNAGREER
jgi:hypothetical protein